MSNQSVLQSGIVTPGHLASWATDGVLQDAGVTFTNTYGVFQNTALNINFNATNTDTPIAINLPAGYTRYRIKQILLSGASGTLSTATCGVFTATGAGGTAIVTSATAITVTSASSDTNHNMQSFTINNQDTLAWFDTTIYFRVQTPQGVAATGNVAVFYEPLP